MSLTFKDIITLNWFKENNERTSIENRALIKKGSKPYSRLFYSDGTVTIIFPDGLILVRSEIDKDLLQRVIDAPTKESIEALLAHKQQGAEIGSKEDLAKLKEEMRHHLDQCATAGFELLKQHRDFEVKDNLVYFKGINRSLPGLLVRHFCRVLLEIHNARERDLPLDYLEQEYLSLKRFQLWAFLNPRAEVADMIYNFLTANVMRLTKQGFIVALRNVVTVGNSDTEATKFITNAYNKIKAVWKKNPKNYSVFKSDEGEYSFSSKMEDEHCLGNLQDLYDNISDEPGNRFTDAHTKTFDIRVGKKVWMDPKDCSWSTADCNERGLHFTMDEINYVGCGDTSVLILINPMKIVGIGSSKGRCYEYLPIMAVPTEEVTRILYDEEFDTLQLDESYAIEELENLEDKVKEGLAVETHKHEFNLPKMNTEVIHKIVGDLTQIKREIEDRIVNID